MADLGFWAIAADEPEHLALVEADGTEPREPRIVELCEAGGR